MSKKKKQKGRAGENENVEDKITIGGKDYEVDPRVVTLLNGEGIRYRSGGQTEVSRRRYNFIYVDRDTQKK